MGVVFDNAYSEDWHQGEPQRADPDDYFTLVRAVPRWRKSEVEPVFSGPA